MLCGYPPFNGGNEYLTYELVKVGDVKFPSPSWDHISEGAISFLKTLLNLDPDERVSAAEALEDPWLNQEKVHPYGLAWVASFIPHMSYFHADHHRVKHTDKEKRSKFANFMKHVKVSSTMLLFFLLPFTKIKLDINIFRRLQNSQTIIRTFTSFDRRKRLTLIGLASTVST